MIANEHLPSSGIIRSAVKAKSTLPPHYRSKVKPIAITRTKKKEKNAEKEKRTHARKREKKGEKEKWKLITRARGREALC